MTASAASSRGMAEVAERAIGLLIRALCLRVEVRCGREMVEEEEEEEEKKMRVKKPELSW